MKSGYFTLVLVLSLSPTSRAGTVTDPESTRLDTTISTPVVVLPFRCLGAESGMKQEILRRVTEELGAAHFSPVPDTLVEAILRRQRLRDTSQLSANDAAALSQQTGAPWILLGSLDVYQESEQDVEVGLSARFLLGPTGQTVWAGSYHSSGDDYANLLNLGRIRSATELAQLQIARLVQDLHRWWIQPTSPADTLYIAPNRLLIIPFDNLTETLNADQIVTILLLSTLVEEGYPVIEPGVINEQLHKSASSLRGDIDFQTLTALAQPCSAAYCLLGAVFELSSELNNASQEVPTVEISMRLLETRSGKLLWARQKRHTGVDFTKIFQIGTIYARGQLIQATLREMLMTLPPEVKSALLTRI